MDDPPQNSPGISQAPPTQNTNIQPQYPAPEPPASPHRRLNPFIIAALALLALLLIVAAVVFVQDRRSRPAACSSEACFTQRFSQCSPAAYTYNQTGNSVKYTIIGSQSIGCSVTVNYLKAQYYQSAEGKNMTCSFDNSQSFQKAAQNVFHFPEDYDCKGNLADIFKGVGSESTEP